jgi:hypothetical protein
MGTMLRTLAIGTAAVALAASTSVSIAGSAPDPQAPDPCSPVGVAGLITDFFTAFNRGDAQAAVQIMDPQVTDPRNSRLRGWFALDETDSTGPGRFHSFRRRAPVARYFERRHRHHETLRLLTVIVGTGEERGSIWFRVRRDADDLDTIGVEKNRIALGKGAVLCKRGKIFVWSMGHPDERVTGPKCPADAQACARRRP